MSVSTPKRVRPFLSADPAVALDLLAQSLVDGITECSRRLRTVDLPAGLTRERVAAMALIAEHGRISVTQLARLLNVRAQTVSRMLSSLVADGLARKSPEKSDGRGVVISLTQKGRRALTSAQKKSVEHLRRQLEKLTPDQVAVLTMLARALASDDR